MGKTVTWFANLEVLPLDVAVPDKPGETEDGKQLVFTDHESGEVVYFPMGKDLVDKVGKRLRMSNKALVATLQEEQERERARQMLAGGNGPLDPQSQKVVKDILKGSGASGN